MDKSILMQKKVRESVDNLQSYVSDLKQWEADMKRKEAEITGAPLEKDLPPVRSKVMKPKVTTQKAKNPEKRIGSSDYQAWDKFDVDYACDLIDDEDLGPESLDGKMSQKEKEERMKQEAQCEKERGNRYFKLEKWNDAIKCYSRAIDLDKKDPVFYANRAQCHLMNESLHATISDCTQALQLDATYVKAYHRRSMAREKLGSLRGASEDLQEIIKLEPKNDSARKKLQTLKLRMGSKGSKSKSSPVTTPTSEKPPLLPSPKILEISEEIRKTTTVEEQIKEVEKLALEPKNSNAWKDGSLDGVTIVSPVNKPPHLRSKKPLRQIPIVEIPIGQASPDPPKEEVKPLTRLKIKEVEEISASFPKGHTNYNSLIKEEVIESNIDNSILCNVKLETTAETPMESQKAPTRLKIEEVDEVSAGFLKGNADVLVKEEIIASNIDNSVLCNGKQETRVETPTESQKLKNETCTMEKNNPRKAYNNNIFEIPTSSVQFITQWKSMRNKLDKRSAFLSAINPESIPKIFGNSLECDLLSEILQTMHDGYDFAESKESQVLPYLIGLTQVPRFSALTMFLSKQDQNVIIDLLEHCRLHESADTNAVNHLKSKFEV